MRHLLLVGILAAVICSATAYREYLRMLPNSGSVPCADPADCITSNGICGGFGHDDCLSSDENDFGEEFGEDKLWTVAFCRRDDDNDDKSNGDELGDPCCRWNRGSTPDRTTGISHPGERSSETSNPSCSRNGAPDNVGAVTVEDTGSSRLKVSWPMETATCVCHYDVAVTVTAGGASAASASVPNRFDQTDLSNGTHYVYYVTGLTAGTGYTIEVTTTNLAGSASGVQTTATTDAASTPLDSQTLPDQDLTVTTAGVVGDLSAVPSALGPFYAFLIILILLGWLIGVRLRDPNSRLRYWAVHRSIINPPVSRLAKLTVTWLSELTWVTSIATLGAVFAIAGVFFLSKSRNDDNIFPFNDSGLSWRSFGHAGVAAMAFTLYPITRYSIWMPLLGISFERALVYHRWLGMWTTVLVLVHSVAMWVVYSNSTIGTSQFWSGGYNFNVISGVFATICMLILAAFAIEWVRRRRYGWFFTAHTLSIVIVFLTLIHYPKSGFYIAIPLALYALDLAFIIWKGIWTPTKVLKHRTYDEPDSKSPNELHHIMELQLQNRHIRHVKAGQYVYLFIPKLSFLPHPFSICHTASADAKNDGKPDDSSKDGVPFRVCIKPMSNSSRSWTKRMMKCMYGKEPMPRVFCVGPFGKPSVQLENMEHVVLFAGGIGVTPITTICAELLRAGNCKRIHFVFIFRAISVLNCVAKELKDMAAAKGVDVVMSLCHTTAKRNVSTDAEGNTSIPMEPIAAGSSSSKVAPAEFVEEDEKDKKDDDGPDVENDSDTADDLSDVDLSKDFTLQAARPDIPAIMAAEAGKARNTGSKYVGVAVCGPERLMHAVREYGHVNIDGVRFLVHSETFEM